MNKQSWAAQILPVLAIIALFSFVATLSGCGRKKILISDVHVKPDISDSALIKPDYPRHPNITAEERKRITDQFLKKIHVPVLASLPLVDDFSTAKFRSSKEAATRCVILYALISVANKAKTGQEITDYFKKYGLWNDVSPDEKAYLAKKKRTQKEDVAISWRIESMNVLLWALNNFDTLPLPLHECDFTTYKNLPDIENDPGKWIASARLRSAEEILNETDLIYRINWATTEARINKKPMPFNFNNDIVYERHYALNWLTFYDDNWDDITTDT